jgi:hypothetical protein
MYNNIFWKGKPYLQEGGYGIDSLLKVDSNPDLRQGIIYVIIIGAGDTQSRFP